MHFTIFSLNRVLLGLLKRSPALKYFPLAHTSLSRCKGEPGASQPHLLPTNPPSTQILVSQLLSLPQLVFRLLVPFPIRIGHGRGDKCSPAVGEKTAAAVAGCLIQPPPAGRSCSEAALAAAPKPSLISLTQPIGPTRMVWMEEPFHLCTTSDGDRIWKESLKGFSRKVQGELTSIRAGFSKEEGRAEVWLLRFPKYREL